MLEVGKKKKECRERVVNRNRGVSGQSKRKSDSISYTLLSQSVAVVVVPSVFLSFPPSLWLPCPIPLTIYLTKTVTINVQT